MKNKKSNCCCGVTNPQRTQGLKTNPEKGSKFDIVKLKGPGCFVSGYITKQGGTNGVTGINLKIDGKSVVAHTFIAAENIGLLPGNSYGVVHTTGNPALDALTIGFPVPLHYKKSLVLEVSVGQTGVAQLVSNVVHGS